VFNIIENSQAVVNKNASQNSRKHIDDLQKDIFDIIF
jgi:hypothetical protein